MSKESFARGFCKVAEAHGIDPVVLAKFAEPILRTNGKVPDATKPPAYDTSRRAGLVRRAIDTMPDIIPSVMGKAHNGSFGAEQNVRGLNDEVMRSFRALDNVRRGGSIDSSGHMSADEQKAWLNAHFRALMAAKNAIQRSPYAHAGNAYSGAMYSLTNDFPKITGNVDVQ